jgi:predicted alpha/beta-fold hydrolase
LVATLTDHFVTRHTPYHDASDYYDRYRLDRAFLSRLRIPVRILATEDDPVLPVEHARALLGGTEAGDVVSLIPFGGHCAFIQDFRLRSALDQFAARHFETHC